MYTFVFYRHEKGSISGYPTNCMISVYMYDWFNVYVLFAFNKSCVSLNLSLSLIYLAHYRDCAYYNAPYTTTYKGLHITQGMSRPTEIGQGQAWPCLASSQPAQAPLMAFDLQSFADFCISNMSGNIGKWLDEHGFSLFFWPILVIY